MLWQLMTVVVAVQAASAGQARVDRLRSDLNDIAQRLQWPVSLTAPLVSTDGSRLGPAVTVTDAATSYYVSSPNGSCDASVSATEPFNVREGWRISARVVSRTFVRSVTVAVEWQRLWSGGRLLANGASAKTEIQLRAGDSVHLDRLETTAPGLICDGQFRTLELEIFGNVINQAPDLPTLAPPSPMTMNVWLVHQSPAGVEATYAVSLPFEPSETQFVFRTQPITSHDDTLRVDLTGAVRAVKREDGSLGLWAGLRRAIVDTSTNTMRVATGSGGSVIAWGTTGEVISFDLPDPAPSGVRMGGSGGRAGGRGAAALPPLPGHKFSVRLQFVPR